MVRLHQERQIPMLCYSKKQDWFPQDFPKIPKINPQEATEREKFVIGHRLPQMANLYFSVRGSHRGRTQSGQQQVLYWLGQWSFLKGERLLQIAVGQGSEELLIWYAKHPTTKKRSSKSIEQATGSIQTGTWQCINSEWFGAGEWWWIIDDDDDDDDDDAGSATGGAGRAAGEDGGLGSWLNILVGEEAMKALIGCDSCVGDKS